jgi:hypothetical protein
LQHFLNRFAGLFLGLPGQEVIPKRIESLHEISAAPETKLMNRVPSASEELHSMNERYPNSRMVALCPAGFQTKKQCDCVECPMPPAE